MFQINGKGIIFNLGSKYINTKYIRLFENYISTLI